MKHFNLLIIFILFSSSIFSQDYSKKFGIINKDDLNIITYKKDNEAEAIVLFDIGESIFFDTDDGYDIRFTRTKRIKILDRAGIKYSETSIPFYVDGFGRTELIKSIEAYTYNMENGRLVKKSLNKNSIFEEKTSKYWKAKKFAFPDVKEGSIIEYKYILETPFHFNLPDWTFQDRIPTLYSKYTVRMIPFYEYAYLAQGITQFDFQDSKIAKEKRNFGNVNITYGKNIGNGFQFQDYVHTYVLKDVAAFKDESFITSVNDYLIKMDFQLSKFHHPQGGTTDIISTWPKLNEELLKNKNFGKHLIKCIKPAKKLLESKFDLKNKNDNDKCEQIVKYVKSNFSWNGSYSKFASKTPKEFIEQKTGNSADINLFLNALLIAARINAKPVIISTRNHQKIKLDYPFAHFFNYVIVLINNSDSFLTDGTEKSISYNNIPLRCINEKGFVIDKEEPKWVSLNNNKASANNITLKININPDTIVAQINGVIQTTKYVSFTYKKSYNNDPTKLKIFLKDKGLSKIKNITTHNFENNNKRYIINFQGEAMAEKISNKIIVSPFLNFPLIKNKLTQEKRTYPVDFIFSKTEIFNSTINIPIGFKLMELPEKYSIDNELVNINIEYDIKEKEIVANAIYTNKKPVYNTNEYSRIKYYINIMIKKFNEQIVFEKI